MKFASLLLITFVNLSTLFSQSVGIGTNTPNNSAVLDIQSSNKGLLPPRMSTLQRKAIPSPANGLVVYDTDKGSLYLFNGSGWAPLQMNEKADETPSEKYATVEDLSVNSNFGKSVGISGNYAIVGANTDSVGSNPTQGSAFIFEKVQGNWMMRQKLVAPDGAAADHFGQAVSISGNYAAVGAPDNKGNGTTGIKSGAVYIFQRTGSSWNFQFKVLPSFGYNYQMAFGAAVSLDGDYLVVGAPLHSSLANVLIENCGAVFFYNRSNNSWLVQDGKEGSEVSEKLGSSVSIDSAFAAAGAPFKNNGSNIDEGRVQIFRRSGTSWQLEKNLLSALGGSFLGFGYSLDISNSQLVVGLAQDNNGYGFRVYKREFLIVADWVAVPTTTIGFNFQAGSINTAAVAFSSDNQYMVVSYPYFTLGYNTFQGALHVFKWRQDRWQFHQLHFENPGGFRDQLGEAVAGDAVFIANVGRINENLRKPKVVFLDFNNE